MNPLLFKQIVTANVKKTRQDELALSVEAQETVLFLPGTPSVMATQIPVSASQDR